MSQLMKLKIKKSNSMEPKAKKARFSNDSNNKIQKLEHVVVEDEFTQADLEELEFFATQMDKIVAVENSL